MFVAVVFALLFVCATRVHASFPLSDLPDVANFTVVRPALHVQCASVDLARCADSFLCHHVACNLTATNAYGVPFTTLPVITASETVAKSATPQCAEQDACATPGVPLLNATATFYCRDGAELWFGLDVLTLGLDTLACSTRFCSADGGPGQYVLTVSTGGLQRVPGVSCADVRSAHTSDAELAAPLETAGLVVFLWVFGAWYL